MIRKGEIEASLVMSLLIIASLLLSTRISVVALLSSSSSSSEKLAPRPIDPSDWPDRFPAKEHCSKCGLCETSFVSHVKDACAFLGEGMSRMDHAEIQVHGRPRDLTTMEWSNKNNNNQKRKSPSQAEEARFGVMYEPMRLAKGVKISDAQWTGVVTSIALSMIDSGMVDAVVCIASANDREDKEKDMSSVPSKQKWSYPEPILARTAEDVLKGRGVKPALAPSLKVLDEIQKDPSIQKLLFCGVGCAVQGKTTL